MPPDASRRSKGILVFLAVAFGLGWTVQVQVASSIAEGRAETGLPMLVGVQAPLLMMPLLIASWAARRGVEKSGFSDSGLQLGRLRYALAGWALLLLLVVAAGAASLPFTPLDLGFASMGALLAKHGVDAGLSPTAMAAVQLAYALTLGTSIGTFVAFGQELGWRGYLLPRLVEQVGPARGVVLHGVIWGVWYAPLVVLGGYAYPGHPALGLALWILFCALLGVLLAWLTFASGSLAAAAIAHGVLIATGDLPLMVLPAADPSVCGVLWSPVGLVLLTALLGALAAGGGLTRGLARGPASLQRSA